MNGEHKLKEIVLRDVQPLLRKKLGDELIVDKFTSETLLPPGENYGSSIFSVHAVIRKNKNAEKEDLFLIAKMSPPTEFQKRIFDSPFTFKKETFMYEEIVPAYNKLEIECGVDESQVFNILPKFYGLRLSLDPNVEFDDDAVILLENLKVQGYYTGQRCIGYDYEHSKFAVRALARFHALGTAMKYKKPDYFETLKLRCRCLNFDENEFKDINNLLLKKIEDDPEISLYYDRCNKIFTELKVKDIWGDVPQEPWSTIIHSDFWVNNIMFHRGKDGHVDDIKFVDFQNYLFSSPVRELIFYLFSSSDENVQENHIKYFTDYYHECFVGILDKMGCDTKLFSKESFEKKINYDARFEFLHLCFMLKVLTLDAKETNFDYDDMKKFMAEDQRNQRFDKRLRSLILHFVNRNWI